MIQQPFKIRRTQSKAIIRTLHASANDRIAISTQDGLVIVRYSNILYCEALSNYFKIYLNNGSSVVASKPLKSIDAVLPPRDFMRVHQSYIVRFDAITTAGRELTLTGGIKIPVSRRRYNFLMNALRSQLPII